MNALKARAKQYAIESFLSNYQDIAPLRIEFIKDVAEALNYDYNLPDETIKQQFLDKGYYYYIILTSDNKKTFDNRINYVVKLVRNRMRNQLYPCELCNKKSHHLTTEGCEKCQRLLCADCFYDINEYTCKSCAPCE